MSCGPSPATTSGPAATSGGCSTGCALTCSSPSPRRWPSPARTWAPPGSCGCPDAGLPPQRSPRPAVRRSSSSPVRSAPATCSASPTGSPPRSPKTTSPHQNTWPGRRSTRSGSPPASCCSSTRSGGPGRNGWAAPARHSPPAAGGSAGAAFPGGETPLAFPASVTVSPPGSPERSAAHQRFPTPDSLQCYAGAPRSPAAPASVTWSWPTGSPATATSPTPCTVGVRQPGRPPRPGVLRRPARPRQDHHAALRALGDR